MNINGTTQTCGVIGSPIAHTLSPMIHNTIAEAMGHNLVYLPFLVKSEDIGYAIYGANALNIKGLNVTVPHKSAIIPYLKDMDPLAANIGAVNTLVKIEGGYKGYNTDMTGLLRSLKREGIKIKDRDAILIGAGGAARAVAFMLATEGAKHVYILNRSIEKAKVVADDVNRALNLNKRVAQEGELDSYTMLPGNDYLCIQCTSVGLHPNSDDVVIEDKSFYEKISEAVDIIYKPAETKFMKLCKEAGAKKVVNGLGMLLYQGVDAYELWNDCKVDDKLCDKIYEMMKEATKVE